MNQKTNHESHGVDYDAEFNVFLNEEKHLAQVVRRRVEKYGNSKIAVRHKPYGEWIGYTWQEFGDAIENCARALLTAGTAVGEMVGIFSANSAWWAIADQACFHIRAASVPVYATNSAKELEYIIKDAGIETLFAGDAEQYTKALQVKKETGIIKRIIVFDNRVELAGKDSFYFDDFIASGKDTEGEEYNKRFSETAPEDLSTLIYTSGTTGDPKGVMLTHKNWLAMLFGTGYHIPIMETDVNLAFLPLSHVFERAWSYHILCGNGQVDYCHDTKALLDFLKESRPHYMCSVPRMWEKVHSQVMETINEAPPAKQKLFNWALQTGGRVGHLRKEGKSLSPGLALKHKIADTLVLKKIRNLFGGRNKVFNCGGAPFSGEIAEFFFNTGVLLLQGYGMTECFVICVSTPEKNRFGTCGPVVPLVDIRITDEGEIQAKGPNMTQGYYNKPELTKNLFTDDGWIRTGDIGHLDEDGFIMITDRLKDLFKTSGGKYIAPQQIETLLKEDYYIEQAAAIGDNRKYVSALIVPAFEPLEAWAKKNGIDYSNNEDLLQKEEVLALYRERIDEKTKDLGQVEKVKKFTLLSEEFTQEKGELTPTQKLKRKAVNSGYADIIEKMYKE